MLEETLTSLGFACTRLKFSAPGTPDVENLYARLGTAAPNFCFAGHTDVVPVGDEASWTMPPFEARIEGGRLYGRGAADMKGAIAAFVAAAAGFAATRGRNFGGSVSLLITGDEEGPAVNGTVKVLDWMRERGERMEACVVGEPTNPTRLGETIKIGRRGSLTGFLTVFGRQGHSAYPHLADNPIPRLMRMLSAVNDEPLDQGSAHFQASTLAITTIDVGNPATNVIPAKARAVFNIRFNDHHTGEKLTRWIRERFDRVGGEYELTVSISGESFLTPPGRLSAIVAQAAEAETGNQPQLNTTGGTSDARFIKDHCPVVEFGLVGATMHQTNEHVAVADIATLARIYRGVLDRFFAKP